MKGIYEKAIKVNNDLKLNVDEQQDDIKHWKEQCEIDDEDEVQENTEARNPMKKNKAVYVTCNKTFAMKSRLKKHIQEELWWQKFQKKKKKKKKNRQSHVWSM